MQPHIREIITKFLSKSNENNISQAINARFNNREVTAFLNTELRSSLAEYAKTIYKELRSSEPLFGTSTCDQALYFSGEFIRDRVQFIKQYIITPRTDIYGVNDGTNTARNDYTQCPNALLDAWKKPRSVLTGRDDSSGMTGTGDSYNHGVTNMYSGVVFCDQTNVGVNHHMNKYDCELIALNSSSRPHEDTAFGVSTRAADERLASRRIFRSNEAGEENGITRNAARRHRRNIDRDISEGLNNAEMGNQSRGYDMSGLHARLDAKNKNNDDGFTTLNTGGLIRYKY